MIDDKVLEFGPEINAGGEIELFQNKTLSMSICWGTSAAKNFPTEFTQVWLPFPSNDGTPELEYLINGFCVFDNKDDARAKAAKLFVQFLCDSEKWARPTCWPPAPSPSARALATCTKATRTTSC